MRIERAGELAVVRMGAGRANAMGPAMLAGLVDLVNEVERSDAKAVVLTGDGRSFSAGLALPDLIELQRAQARTFIDAFSHAMTRVFTLARPVVAAIDGHAYAGGFVLACLCDVRFVDYGPSLIVIYEVQLGHIMTS